MSNQQHITPTCIEAGHILCIHIFTEGYDTATFNPGEATVADYTVGAGEADATGEIEICCETCSACLVIPRDETHLGPPDFLLPYIEAAWKAYQQAG